MTLVAPQPAPQRFYALDGLRGIAALAVVIFHAMLVLPALANLVRDDTPVHGWLAVLAYTPVRLLWAGEEAVVVFFVLSGFVLTLPFLHRRFDAVAYYPRRLVRIYVPVWASVMLALAWTQLVPRESVPGASWWVNGHDFDLSLQGFGGDMTLVIGTTWLNSVLWSLKWEMWFSLLLPLYLLVLVRFRRWPLAKLVVLLAAVQAGVLLSVDELRYLPVFGVGVLLAVELERVVDAIRRRSRAMPVALVATLLLLTGSRWLTHDFLSAPSVLCAALLVAAFACWGPTVRFGELRFVRWLGTISFSLYLVHEPVMTSVAMGLRTQNPALVLVVALPLSLSLAALFNRVVETPAHRLSRWVGRTSVALVGRTTSNPTPQGRLLTRRAGTPT